MLQKFEHEDLFNLNTGLGCTKASMTSHVDFFGGLSSCTLILLLFTYPLEKHRKTMDNMFFLCSGLGQLEVPRCRKLPKMSNTLPPPFLPKPFDARFSARDHGEAAVPPFGSAP